MSILSGVAAPAVDQFVAQARLTKAMTDVRVIAVAMVRLSWDVCSNERRAKGWDAPLLAGAGDTPELGEGGDPRWIRPASAVDLTGHLVTNAVAYSTRAAGVMALGTGWRGPYVDRAIGADPWGHRYAVNIAGMAPGTTSDTVVLSAGPNGLIETAFARDGLVAGGDDIVALISSGT